MRYKRATFLAVAAVITFIYSSVFSQSVVLEEKVKENTKLVQELVTLKKKEVILEEEIVKLNNDEYITKLARKEYFMSYNGEIIFIIPDMEM